MDRKPIIGINTDYRTSAKSKAAFLVLHVGYCDSILKAGGIPLILPPVTKQADLDPLIGMVDGLILSGGDDLQPKRIGLRPHMASKVMDPRREESDRMLLQSAYDRKLPTLGIGVGMQLINCFFGGTIYQHLPEDLPRALPHNDPHGGSHRHAIDVTPGSHMDYVYGGGDIRVNSCHHQAIRRVAPNFCATAMAPDGVIEAIECMDPNWFCIGVQWHPHSETGSALDGQLFESLIEASQETVKVMAA